MAGTPTIDIKPELVRWAVKRSGIPDGDLIASFPKLDAWQRGEAVPTIRQVQNLAQKTMTPLGYFFLDKPPDESLPVRDFRTVGDRKVSRPSPNLIETMQIIQARQAWMREYLIEEGHEPLDFVGSAQKTLSIQSLAARIRESLGLDIDWAERHSSWEDALRTLRVSAERIGIFVCVSGVVGLNTRRPLDPQEFRGFVLCDSHAPFVFINGADAKSAQMFTLAHELVHIWLGVGGVFNLIGTMPHADATERFCNQVAAEFLVPEKKLSARWNEAAATSSPFETIARWFKVSPIVAARRALDLGLIAKAAFFAFYEKVQHAWKRRKDEERTAAKGGPDFYVVQDVRLGRRFAYAIARATREGRLLYRDAYYLTSLKGDTFNRYAALLMRRMRDERR